MIEFVFTIDYEIYGNGTGSLRELVLEPTDRLSSLFTEHAATFVTFAEAVEFRKIEEYQSDDGIQQVREQLQGLHEAGFEVGLHLHPWWHRARFVDGHWQLDYAFRNICALPEANIEDIVTSSVEYLGQALNVPAFKPVSFRGGLWLMQPTAQMAKVLLRAGVQIDSSVFKGGLIRALGIDYRPAKHNGYYWRFSSEVSTPDPDGPLMEVPIHTEMVPFWKMLGTKRLKLQRKVPAAKGGNPLGNRFMDFARFTYPRKLDFCRMDYDEMTAMMETVVQEDRRTPEIHKVIVAIGHSKDLVDFESITRFLSYLEHRGIPTTTFTELAARIPGPRGNFVPNVKCEHAN